MIKETPNVHYGLHVCFQNTLTFRKLVVVLKEKITLTKLALVIVVLQQSADPLAIYYSCYSSNDQICS